MKEQYPFPLSMFESVKNPKAIDVEDIRYDDFCGIMMSFAEEDYSSKEAAPLYSTTQFTNNRRSKINASQSGLIVLDIDDGQTIDDTLNIVEELDIAALLYSTASHRDEHHKFRLCIPLLKPVPYQNHVNCWHAHNYIFIEGKSDGSKVGCESLFYVPGQYPNAPSVFEQRDGLILTSEDWLHIADLPEKALINKASVAGTKLNPPQNRSFNYGRAANACDLDIYETKLVTESALNKYRSSNGGWHQARFGLMLSIVGRASRMGIIMSADDIQSLFNQADLIDGGHYQSSKYQTEIANDAAKALAQSA